MAKHPRHDGPSSLIERRVGLFLKITTADLSDAGTEFSGMGKGPVFLSDLRTSKEVNSYGEFFSSNWILWD